MSQPGHWIAFGIGVFLVLATTSSLIRTLVVPRAYVSRLSVTAARRFVRHTFIFIAARLSSYEVKDKILAISAPVSLIVQLIVWLALFGLGYGLILWAFIDGAFFGALREAGSSLFTLGFASTITGSATVVNFFAAFTGLIVIALQIAYLPTIYAAFNRRETLVTMLQSRAGAPAWGPEILARHHLVGLIGNLPDFYAEWERWAAEVAESHTTYPILITFRSPHPLRSWVLGLLAVMDSAALYLALSPKSAPTEARLCLRMGFTALRYIADVVRIPYDADPFPDDPIKLPYDDYLRGIERLREVDFPMERTPDQAWPHFRGWRVNYEDICYQLMDAIVAPPGPWSGERARLQGVTIIPQRPADRTPGDPHDAQPPKAAGFGWRWRA
ncbi:MAG: hypothetical protein KY391_05460 [Actinobacteria bacterium]|nr:hypothetical protein [Actinomycetota bacterium]